jgi:ArsR family transcriptional regulator, arsenate/arsenite/antimonite-responsive transcriptional repressor
MLSDMTTATLLPIRDVTEAAACCAPLLREPLGVVEAEDLARALKAIADPARLRIISIVAASAGGEACVCDLTEPIGLSQPTVSHHLKVLTEAGFLDRSKRGTWAYYRLRPGALDAVSAFFAAA